MKSGFPLERNRSSDGHFRARNDRNNFMEQATMNSFNKGRNEEIEGKKEYTVL